MEHQGSSGGSAEVQGTGLQTLLNRVFRCRHRHKTYPFTPKGSDQCYAVCLDCGQRLPAEPPLAEKPTQSKDSVRETTVKDVEKPREERADQREVARRPETIVKNSSAATVRRHNLHDMLYIGLFVVGLSGGLYFTARTPARASLQAPREEAKGNPPAPAPAPEHEQPSAAIPAPSSEKSAAHSKANRTPRLEDKGPAVVLGFAAEAVRELSENPGRLKDLIQTGSLFTVPRGTRIRVIETKDGVVNVLILQGSMVGREGWALVSQVSR